MALCEPIVVGPVSVLSASFRVQGQLAGAKVQLHALGSNPRVVAHGTASSGDQRFPLSAGAQLAAGDLLVAVQQLGSDTSALPGGNIGVAVAPAPASAAQIGKVGLETHPWECGQYVWVDGAIPGAQVVMVGHGSGIADEGIARFALTQPLATAAVNLHQVVPGVGQGADLTLTPDPVPAAFGRDLPPPQMAQPVRACDPSVLVSGVLDGTLVTIKHADGSTVQAGFDRSALHFVLPVPLAQGDTLAVRQQFQGGECAKRFVGVWSNPPLLVGPAKPVEPPVVEGPLCAGTSRVTLSGLRPGATVAIHADGNTYQGAVPPELTTCTFGVAPLVGGSVTATQEICGVTSKKSAAVTVNPQEDVVDPPSIVGPLYECARSVSIAGAHQGATVQIWATHPYGDAPISNLVTVQATQATIAVSPYLQKGDHVYAIQWACTTTGATSAAVAVAAAPALPAPTVLRAFARDATVYVQGGVPGALVEVYVKQGSGVPVYAGHAVATTLAKTTAVPISSPLALRDQVSAHQRLCNAVSKSGEAVTVGAFDAWLSAQPALASAIVWEDANGAHPWSSWSAQRKADLDTAFAVARNGGSIPVATIPPNQAVLADTDGVIEILATHDAWAYFLSSVAQSLAFETAERLPWTVSGYNAAELAQLFDSRRMFSWVTSPVAGYEIEGGTAGNVVPAPPAYSYDLLASSGLIGGSSLDTVVNAVGWCHQTLLHFPGGSDTANMFSVWQYRGLAPMARTVEGTIQSSTSGGAASFGHWTAGCWGTTGFLIALLRAVNLPVTLLTHAGHAQPWFMSVSLYLSHGDDPYNALTWAAPPIPNSEILTDEVSFNAWFGPGVPAADVANNIGRRTIDLSITYLPNYLLQAYCADMAAATPRASGQVMQIFAPIYTEAELEAQTLWSRMDAKIAGFGGCANVPYV